MLKIFQPRLWALLLVLCAGLAHAQETGVTLKPAASLDDSKQGPGAKPQPFYSELWDGTVGSTSDLWKNGEWGLIVPAWTVHMRFAYSKEQRNDQNNNPMPGIGVSKGKYLPNGNWHGLYAMGSRDSWDKPQWMLGYNYNWMWRSGDVRYGWGAVTGLMMRNDYFSYAPFPFILPSFQVNYKRVALEATYVPGIKRGTGNVAFFWLRIQ